MKKIERDSILYLVLQSLTTAIMGIIIWPLFDLILCKFITNSKFVYSIHNHIIQPIIFGIIISIVFWVSEKHSKKNK